MSALKTLAVCFIPGCLLAWYIPPTIIPIGLLFIGLLLEGGVQVVCTTELEKFDAELVELEQLNNQIAEAIQLNTKLDASILVNNLTKGGPDSEFRQEIADRTGKRIEVSIQEIIRTPGSKLVLFGIAHVNDNNFVGGCKNTSTVWFKDVCLGSAQFKLPPVEKGDAIKITHEFKFGG